jgi:anti-sigma factor RsiW
VNDEHRDIRLLLGAYALGHLDDNESATVRAHLDGCPTCRAELADLAPLRARLDAVDPTHLDDRPVTPPDLDPRILGEIRHAEAASATRRLPLRALGLVAATVLIAGISFAIGWALEPGSPAVPLEAVAVQVADPIVRDLRAELVAHTWGMEIKLSGSGFRDGERYLVDVVAGDGTVSTAGAFIGIGDRSMDCNLNSAVLRDDATGFEVRDAAGDLVVSSSF